MDFNHESELKRLGEKQIASELIYDGKIVK